MEISASTIFFFQGMLDLVANLGCAQGMIPIAYLYLVILLAASYEEIQEIWNLVMERIHKKLSTWEEMYLFKGGK